MPRLKVSSRPPDHSAYRPMSEDDLAEVIQIENEAYEYPWSAGIFNDCLKAGYLCRLLADDSGILGYGVLMVAAGEGHLLNLTIRPEKQGGGLGRKLLGHLIHIARRHGAGMLFLEVRPSNKAAFALYTQTGFNEVGLRRNYYPAAKGREDALILALTLSSLSSV